MAKFSNQITGAWPPVAPYTVVGYRFRSSGDGPGEGSSLVEDSRIDLEKLRALTVTSAELSPEQADRLVNFVFADREKTMAAACYDPHHLFLIHGESGDILNAVEICFDCINLNPVPDVGKDRWYRYDFRGLARLCEEIGIGMDVGTADEFIRNLDERGKE